MSVTQITPNHSLIHLSTMYPTFSWLKFESNLSENVYCKDPRTNLKLQRKIGTFDVFSYQCLAGRIWPTSHSLLLSGLTGSTSFWSDSSSLSSSVSSKLLNNVNNSVGLTTRISSRRYCLVLFHCSVTIFQSGFVFLLTFYMVFKWAFRV